MEACGICGSDVMDWYANAKAPVVLGHEPIGRVVARGEITSDVDPRPALGDRVFIHHHVPCNACRLCASGRETLCRVFRASRIEPGGFAEFILVPAANAAQDTLVIPPELDLETATLIEPLACVVRGQDRVEPDPDPDAIVAVIGLGQIGLLHVALAGARGARRIAALDPIASRVARAADLGATPAGATAASFLATFGDRGAARIYVATGSPAAIETAVEIAGDGAWIELFAPTRPDAIVGLRPYDLFFREVTLVSSYSAGPRDTREALRLLAGGLIDASAIVTHRFPLSQTALALATQAGDETAVKVIVRAEAR
jgi:L-iditol 2-dehydrogenase